MYRSQQQTKKIYAIAFLVSGIFLVCSLILLRNATWQIEQTSILHLYETTSQLRVLLQRKLTQNFQALRGLSTAVVYMPQQETSALFKELNSNRSFIRIGMADTSGMAAMMDRSGPSPQHTDFSDEDFFRNALAGRAFFSSPRKDPHGPGQVIYCAVPVEQEGGVIGVLVGVIRAENLLDILDEPLFNANGFAGIIDANGHFVLCSGTNSTGTAASIFTLGQIDREDLDAVRADLGGNRRNYFLYKTGDKQHLAAFDPITHNGWFLFCSAPLNDLALVPRPLLYGGGVTIILALLVFLLLAWRVHCQNADKDRQLQTMALTTLLTDALVNHSFRLEGTALLHNNPDITFAIWLADIKNFNFYSRMLGKEAGNSELRRIARMLKGWPQGPLTRRYHIVGNTFAGILPFANCQDLAERFSDAAQEVEHGAYRFSQVFPLRLYAGVYTTDMVEEKDLTFMDMLNRAGIAMQVAKTFEASTLRFYSEEICEEALHLDR